MPELRDVASDQQDQGLAANLVMIAILPRGSACHRFSH